MSRISSIQPPVVTSVMKVWQALESSRGLTAVAASWRERLGDQFEVFKDAFLQRAAGVPKGMPCPRGCGCTHEIVAEEFPSPNPIGRGAMGEGELSTINSPPSTIRALCRCAPPACPDILLSPDDIVLLELSWTKLARALCRVFALDYKPVDLGLLNTRQLGSWSVNAVPAILTIQHESGWFRTVLLELIARLRQPFILLAPTAKNLDSVSCELLASSGAAFFSLDATVRLTDESALHLTNALPGELFAKFRPQQRDDGDDVASRAFALVHQLDSQGTRKSPGLLAVFRMYCIDGFAVTTIARKCGISRVTVRQRLKLVETKTGMNIDQLRKFSAHLEKAEATFADSRASHIHGKNLIYDEDDSNES